MPNPGDELDLDIGNAAHGGVFVARSGETDASGRGGRVIFVPDVLPGERVRVRLTETRRSSFWRAEAVRVLRASPFRQQHVWSAASIDTPTEHRAGGAEFGHIELAEQRRLKSAVLTDALHRFGRIERAVPVEPVPGESPDGTRWRTRVSLHVDECGRIGPYAARSRDVVAVTELPLATEAIEAAFLGLSVADPGRVDLVQPADGEVRVLRRSAASGPANETLIERVAQREFRVHSAGFWQVHRGAATALTAAVREALAIPEVAVLLDEPEAIHLDLYGGVGLFAACLLYTSDAADE